MVPAQAPRNRALGFVRFLVWLMPAVVVIGCAILCGLMIGNFGEGTGPVVAAVLVGLAGIAACGWFDSQLAGPCRGGHRTVGMHIMIFMLLQVLIVPASLIATVFAVCGGMALFAVTG